MTRAKKTQSVDAAACLNLMTAFVGSVRFDDQYLDLDGAKQRFERGDKSALAYALYFCALGNHRLPDWVMEEFIDAFWRLNVTFEYSSWDEVFGRPHPGAHVSQKQPEFHKRAQVWVMVTKLRRENKHREAFQPVAKELNISVGTARKYYYAVNKQVGPDLTLDTLEKMAARIRDRTLFGPPSTNLD
jgi:hypothetical protein